MVTCEECPLLLRFHSAIHISERALKLLTCPVRFGTALTGASDNEQRPTRLVGMHSSQSWARRAFNQGSAHPVKESVVNTFSALSRGHLYSANSSEKQSCCCCLLLLSRFSRVQLCATPQMAAHQAPPSLGFFLQEHWSGLPFPSPVCESEVAAA